MAIKDYIRETRQVGGSAVAKPSLVTVLYALSCFRAEIVAAHETAQAHPGQSIGDPEAVIRTVVKASDERLHAVLATCYAGQVHAGNAYEVLAAVLSLCDFGRIVRALDLDAVKRVSGDDQAAAAESETDAVETMIVGVARAFSCSPEDVMAWPYEMLLSVVDVLHPKVKPKDWMPAGAV